MHVVHIYPKPLRMLRKQWWWTDNESPSWKPHNHRILHWTLLKDLKIFHSFLFTVVTIRFSKGMWNATISQLLLRSMHFVYAHAQPQKGIGIWIDQNCFCWITNECATMQTFSVYVEHIPSTPLNRFYLIYYVEHHSVPAPLASAQWKGKSLDETFKGIVSEYKIYFSNV